MTRNPLRRSVCGVLLFVLAGCGNAAVPGTPVRDAAESTSQAAQHEPESGAPSDSSDVLDGRDPCAIVGQAEIGKATDTEIKTADPQVGPDGPVGPNGTACMFNEAEEGVTSAFIFYPAEDFEKADVLPSRADRTQTDIQVPGAEDAFVSRSHAHDQPEVEVCGTVGDVVACAYTTAFLNRSMSDLEDMATDLTQLLAKAL